MLFCKSDYHTFEYVGTEETECVYNEQHDKLK